MIRLIYLVLVSVLLTGCGGEKFQDLRDFVKNTGADMRGKIPLPPDVKLHEPFVYDNETSLPDPFKLRKPKLTPGSRSGINQLDLERPKEALKGFPLEGLKVVGYFYRD